MPSDGGEEVLDPLPRDRRNRHGTLFPGSQSGGRHRIRVGLVEGVELGHGVSADLPENRPNGVDVAVGIGGGRIHDMDQQVGVDHHVERRTEGLDQLVGQLADEADGVGQEDGLAAGELQAPRGGVERGEEAILDQDPGVGHAVQKGGLAGVRVADDGDRAVAGVASPLRLGGPVLPDAHQVLFEPADPAHEAPSVDLELGLARASCSDTAGLLAEGPARAPQARKAVAQLCQLDLGPAGQAAGVLGEDVEDHGGAVERGTLQDRLEVALLRRGEFVVEHDGVGVVVLGDVADLGGLAAAHVGGDVGGIPTLKHPGHRIGTSRVNQAGQFVHRGVDLLLVVAAERHAGQHDALPEGPVDEAPTLAAELSEGATVRRFVRSLLVGLEGLLDQTVVPVVTHVRPRGRRCGRPGPSGGSCRPG